MYVRTFKWKQFSSCVQSETEFNNWNKMLPLWDAKPQDTRLFVSKIPLIQKDIYVAKSATVIVRLVVQPHAFDTNIWGSDDIKTLPSSDPSIQDKADTIWYWYSRLYIADMDTDTNILGLWQLCSTLLITK